MGVISAAIPNGDVDRSDAAGAALCALPCLPFGSKVFKEAGTLPQA